MPSTVEELSPTRVKLTIEVPFTQLKPSLDKAYRQIAQNVTIPGFRKGKVPTAIIDQRFGRGAVIQEAVNEVLPQALGEALTEHGIVPLGEPQVEITRLEDNDVFEFTAEMDRRPEFTVPELSSIKVTVDPLQEDEAGVDERLDTLRQRFATYTEVDRAAAEGDVVTVDLAGSQDGKALEEATAEGVQFKIGGSQMLEGLNEAVTGLKAGEQATFTSELVGGSLKGQQADITVTLQKVTEQKLPELDDDFAQMVSEFDTVEEMKADLAKGAQQMATLEHAAAARDKVLEELVKATDIELPEGLVTSEKANRHAQIEQQLQQAGMTMEQYLTEVEEGRSAEDFWAEVDDRSVTALKAQMILDKIAEEREIQLDQADLTEYLMRRAQQQGTSPEQEVQHMMEHNHMQEWMGEIRRNKALAIISEAATVTDTDGNTVDLTVLAPRRQEVLDAMAAAQAAGDLPADDAAEARAEGDSAQEG